MSKEYNLYCVKHGRLRIEVERPPIISKIILCPWCTQKPIQPDKDTQKKWQPGYMSEGALA